MLEFDVDFRNSKDKQHIRALEVRGTQISCWVPRFIVKSAKFSIFCNAHTNLLQISAI